MRVSLHLRQNPQVSLTPRNETATLPFSSALGWSIPCRRLPQPPKLGPVEASRYLSPLDSGFFFPRTDVKANGFRALHARRIHLKLIESSTAEKKARAASWEMLEGAGWEAFKGRSVLPQGGLASSALYASVGTSNRPLSKQSKVRPAFTGAGALLVAPQPPVGEVEGLVLRTQLCPRAKVKHREGRAKARPPFMGNVPGRRPGGLGDSRALVAKPRPLRGVKKIAHKLGAPVQSRALRLLSPASAEVRANQDLRRPTLAEGARPSPVSFLLKNRKWRKP